MADQTTYSRNGEDDALWEMIPWYVNGSLSDEDSASMDQRKEADPAFAAEVDRQLALATGVCMLTEAEIDAAEARSWAKLSARIEAEEAARMPVASGKTWLSGVLSALNGKYALAGVACAALMLAVFATGLTPSQSPDDFRTLTSDPEQAGLVIKVQPAAGLERSELEQILSKNGLVLIDGPSDTGVYRVTAAEGADLEVLSTDLMAAPEIMFAAPEQ